jgi:hypothetical protein
MPPLDPEHKASDRYGLIAVAIGGAIGIDIGRWFSAWRPTPAWPMAARRRRAASGPPTGGARFWFAVFAFPLAA